MSRPTELRVGLQGKGEDDRVLVARRVGRRLSLPGIPEAERRAAETLALELAADAIERVRRELSIAVKHAKFLPRELAIKIAHDVDSVACPFLESTQVFSDGDWQQLVATISRGARIAVARRTSMSEGLALALAKVGDPEVGETLVGNPTAPMTPSVCDVLMERFVSSARILDKLAERDGLAPAVVARLCALVSEAARRKLAEVYRLPDFTYPVGVEAEHAALLRLIGETPEFRLPALTDRLKQDGKLTHLLLMMALRNGSWAFFAVALSALSSLGPTQVKHLLLHGRATQVIRLFGRAGIPPALHDNLWDALHGARLKELDRGTSRESSGDRLLQ
jgi:uncharacterized protein (DUF2336 family)